MKRRTEIEGYAQQGKFISSYHSMREYAIELETELEVTKRQLEAAQATIRALQASNHVIFN